MNRNCFFMLAVRGAPLLLGIAAALAEPLRHSIPEPMVFDLVRPLGARRGELEINTLAHRTYSPGAPLAWAPEVEYAFADGYSAEFELPFEGSSLHEFKAALQGTIGVAAGERLIHGWQAIGRLNRGHSGWSADMLHLAGYSMNSSWSIVTMQGMRKVSHGAQGQWAGIVNPSIFRVVSPAWTIGVETNLILGRSALRQQLVMPQVQIQTGSGWLLQTGAGLEARPFTGVRPAFAIRLTKVLR